MAITPIPPLIFSQAKTGESLVDYPTVSNRLVSIPTKINCARRKGARCAGVSAAV